MVRGYKKGKGFALRAGIIELFGGIATLATLPCTYLFGDMYFFLPIGITTVLFYMNKLTKK